MGSALCWLGLHKWILGKVLPARFCQRCGLLQHWRLPGMKSWTTVGRLMAQMGTFDEHARDRLDDFYITWGQTGSVMGDPN